MRKLWLSRLKARIILQAAAVALLPMLALATVALVTLYNQQIDTTERHLQAVSQYARQIIVTDLNHIKQTLRQAAAMPTLRSTFDPIEFDHLLFGIPSAQSVSLISPEGRLINGADRLRILNAQAERTEELPTDDVLRRAQQDGIAWSPIWLSALGEPLIQAVVPRIRPEDGQVRDYLMAVISLRQLWDEVTTPYEGDISQMVVVDTQGAIIAHPDYSVVLQGTRWEGLPRDSHRVLVRRGIQSESIIGCMQVIEPTGWRVVVYQARDQALDPMFVLFRQILAALVLTILASAIPGLWIAHQVTHPISQLSADAARVGQGDLQVRSRIQRSDEIGQLATAFNQMVASLEESTLRLNQVVDQRTQQLRQALERAEESDRMKTAFLGTVTHELRTPLASIKGFAETLLAEDVEWDAESQRDFLRTIVQEADRLHGLVNQLLDMTRIESGNLQLQRRACAVEDILEKVERRVQPLIKEHNVEIILPDVLPPICADPDMTANIVYNLVENAIKYTPPKTSITITAQALCDGLLISVHDDGPGIDPTLQSRLFTRFSRGNHPDIPGTGLGLAICKGLVESHGGRIWVDSAPDRGTAFHFVMPYAHV